jgi:hypothetical protein
MISLEAAVDLSAKQYYLVKVDANGKADLCGDNGNAIGVLQNNPTAGKSATVMINGVSKFVGSASLAPDTIIASNAAGKGKAAAALGPTLGVVLVNPGADAQIGTMTVQRGHFAAS